MKAMYCLGVSALAFCYSSILDYLKHLYSEAVHFVNLFVLSWWLKNKYLSCLLSFYHFNSMIKNVDIEVYTYIKGT